MRTLFRLGVVVELVQRVTGPVQQALRAISDLEQAAKKAAAIAAMAGTIGMAGLAASQAAEQWRGAVFDLVAPTMQVEDAIAALATVTTSTMGGVQESLEATRQAALEWSRTYSDTATTFLNTSTILASAGLNDIQAIEGTRVALTVARATMADTAETANTLAVLYNNLGDKTADVRTEMTRLGDILAQTQALYQIPTLGALAEGLKYATPSALAFGTGIEELNVALGALNNAGLQGGQAGTAYAAAMRQMIKASQQLGFEIVRNADGGISFIGTLVALRQKFGETSQWSDELIMRMQKAFGDEGLRAINLLINKTDDLVWAWQEVANANGIAAAQQTRFESTTSSQLKVLQNNLTVLRMTLSQSILPTVNELIPRVLQLAESFGQWVQANPEISRMGVAILAIGAGILTVVAPILTATSAFLSMTAGGMRAGIWIARQMLSLGGTLRNVGSAVETLQIRWLYAQDSLRAGWGRLVTATRGGISSLRTAGQAIANVSRSALTAAATGLRSMATGLYQMAAQAIRAAVTALPGVISATWSFTAALLANPITWVVLAIVGLITAIVLLWRNWDRVTTWMRGAWDALKAAFAAGRDFLAGVLNAVVGFFRENWNAILMVVAPFIGIPVWIIRNWDTIRTFFSNLWQNLRQAAITGLTAMGEWIISELQGVYNWIVGLKDRFLEAGRGLFTAFTDGVKAAINAPVELVKSGVQKIRNLLPGSDAKEGPLSTLTRSGRALVTTFGGGMVSQLPSLRERFAAGLANVMNVTQLALSAGPEPALAMAIPAPNISLTAPDRQPQRQIIIQKLVLRVGRMDRPQDLLSMLERLADEVEYDDGTGEEVDDE